MRNLRTYTVCCIALLQILYGNNILVSSAEALKKAAKNAMPGDTITLSNGEWKDQHIVMHANGTEQLPIVVRAETAGSVILNGSSTLRFSGTYIIVDGLLFKGGMLEKNDVIEFRTASDKLAENCRLTNCAIVDYNPEDKWTEYKWVSMYGKKNRIDHCTFINKNNQGTLLVVWLGETPNDNLIDHNYFGPRPEHGENGAEIIRIGTSDWSMFTSRTIVEHNYFYSCDGEVEIISNKSCENIYRYNTFVECAGTLTLRHGNRCLVYGNYFFGNKKKNTGGVRLIGEDHKVFNNYFNGLTGNNAFAALPMMNGVQDSKPNGYLQVKNAVVAFNTFVDNKYNILFGVMGSDNTANLPAFNCTIANNLVVSQKGMLLEERTVPQNVLYQGNIFDGDELSIKSQTSNFEMKKVEMELGADSVWRPKPNSIIVGTASGWFNFVTDDIDGQMRGKRKDVGADQISKEQIKNRPLKANDVGISWQVQ